MGSPTPAPSPGDDPVQVVSDYLGRYGIHLPHWFGVGLALLIAIGTIWALASKGVVPLLSAARRGFATFVGWRKRHSQAAVRRARFADHLESQLRRLAEKEEWRDEFFAELEAEVEIEGRRRGRRATVELKRVGSLSKALRNSNERLILLQGDPGSGKSVALRHVAQSLATKAMRHPRPDALLPLYINLKEFKPQSHPVSDDQVKAFVCQQVNKANSRDVDRFLQDEFDRGMNDGTWLFLFDSFDEIPDILGSTESDGLIEEYSDALFSFLHGMNTCRGVIASRDFRGPRRSSVPHFRLAPLSDDRQRDLVARLLLPRDIEGTLYDGLAADTSVNLLTTNPLFLGLLCEHLREGGKFPSTPHIVYESYVETRLNRDSEMLRQRFGLSPGQVRQVAEELAYAMAAGEGLGLTPSRKDLLKTLDALGRTPPNAVTGLAALEYIKLARAPEVSGPSDELPFTFAHRRFQEYFATCVVLREPALVSTDDLLLDGRWRETAVTILQTQQGPRVEALLDLGTDLLVDLYADSPDLADSPFRWPPKSLHLLSLLTAGTTGSPHRLPEPLRETTASFLRRAWNEGRRHDKFWVVEHSGAGTEDFAIRVLEKAFASGSSLLQEEAYKRAGQVSHLPRALELSMRRCLVGLSVGGRLRREKQAVAAMIRRLNHPESYLHTMNLLLAIPMIDATILTAVVGTQLMTIRRPDAAGIASIVILTILIHGSLYLMRGSEQFALVLPHHGKHVGRFTVRTPFVRGAQTSLGFAGFPLRMLGVSALVFAPAFTAQDALGRTWGLAILASMVAAFWAPAALYAAAGGLPTGYGWWPLFPVTAAVHLVKWFPWRRMGRRFLALLLVGGLALWFGTSLMDERWIQLAGIGLTILFGGTGTVLMAGAAYILLGKAGRVRADRRSVAAILDTEPPLRGAQLLETLRALQTNEGLRLLITAIRRERIVTDSDCIKLLSDCGEAKIGSGTPPLGSGPEFREWFEIVKSDRKSARAVRYMDQDNRDQIARLAASRSG